MQRYTDYTLPPSCVRLVRVCREVKASFDFVLHLLGVGAQLLLLSLPQAALVVVALLAPLPVPLHSGVARGGTVNWVVTHF